MDAMLVVLQTLLIVALAPLFEGVVAKFKARFQMRRGASVFQPYSDLARLLHKESVVSEDASWLARVTPYLAFAAMLTAATWTPVLVIRNPLSFAGDLVATVALLALMRVLTSLAALESGTAFAGLASSRHLALSALAEPALMLAVFTLALGAGSTQLARISESVAMAPHGWLAPSHLLALAAVALVLVSETARVPVDDGTTHLELTMVHEGLSLDYSGRHLALLQWASRIRQMLLVTLLVSLFLPWGMAFEVSAAMLGSAFAAWLLKLLLCAIGVALLESLLPRMRLLRVPEFLGMAFLLAVLALASDSLVRG